MLDAQPQVRQSGSAASLVNSRGRIAFEGVCFSYSGNGEEPVLSDVSFVADPGETVAIVGATGSGKSSLVHLIPRFYDATAGRITLDGIDVRDLDLHALRGAIGIALQESVLFSGDRARQHPLWPDDRRRRRHDGGGTGRPGRRIHRRASDGYDTVVGQRGVTLSGGQRQRIAIARALLVKPTVLILDDATSALDIETEVRLQDALDRLIGGFKISTTRFIIAQRISSVLLADKIIVLDQGRIAAIGTHNRLIDTSELYRDIYRSQLGEPREGKAGHHG